MAEPKFSIVVATFNSARTLERCLSALRSLEYPQDRVEILVVDGGSTDATREIARRHGCRIVENPRVEPVSAKLIGLREATGDYLMHVDADEVLMDPQALRKRVQIFTGNPLVKMIFASGYVTPPGAPLAARYINEFGDPFSMFFYYLSKDARYLNARLRKWLPVEHETETYTVYVVTQGSRQPIMENAACANTIELAFFRTHFPDLLDKPWGPVHFFYHMQKHTHVFALTKNDPVMHYSADSLRGFLTKIRWRIRNNVFFSDDMGKSGFSGRVNLATYRRPYKQYLYLPYAFLVLPALLDALWLMLTRRDARYILHVPLTLYTALLICSLYTLKLLGYKPELRSYDGKAAVPARKA